MIPDTHSMRLDFKPDIRETTDQCMGIKIYIGHVYGLPSMYAKYNGKAMAWQDAGIGQGYLDKECHKLATQCAGQKIDMIITRSDFDRDLRWFILGDIKGMLERAKSDRLHCPLTNHMYDGLLKEF